MGGRFRSEEDYQIETILRVAASRAYSARIGEIGTHYGVSSAESAKTHLVWLFMHSEFPFMELEAAVERVLPSALEAAAGVCHNLLTMHAD